MTKQAQVGLFTLVGLIAIFAVFYVISDFGTRARGYKIGVRFPSASGLNRGASVSLSGVPVGAVDDIRLEPDYTTDVILAIKPEYSIPIDSKFVIRAPLTGEPSILIQPPQGTMERTMLPQEILPLDQQPRGTTPATVADLLEEGQGEIKRFDRILTQLEYQTPALLGKLNSALTNANELAVNANASFGQLSAHADAMIGTLQGNADQASRNVVALTNTLNGTAQRESGRVDGLITQLNQTSHSFGIAVDALRDVATDPSLKRNFLETAHSFALTAHTLSELTNDLRQVTGNPQTQAQMRDTVAQIDASTQKLDSLLGSLGGKSTVYGVDKGASPAPGGVTPPPAGFVPTSRPALAPSPTSAVPAPANSAAPRSAGQLAANLRNRLNNFTKDLVELQVRISQLSPAQPSQMTGNVSPLLTSDRGPMTDFNVRFLPKGQTSVLAGVNDAGGNATTNFMLINRRGGLQYGGGMEYSRFGLMTALSNANIGLEARIYDLRHPTLDAYGNLYLAPKFQIFGGERDTTHRDRRTVFGLQFEL